MVKIRSKNVLLLVLFVVTVVLTALPPIFVPLSQFKPSWDQFLVIMGALGAAHVGTTSFFYIGDRRYKELIRDHTWR